jgi:proteic killer suppression protein
VYKVNFKLAEKSLHKVPLYIRLKAHQWAASVEEEGLEEIRKKPGFHDELLKGKLQGFRSVRLNRSYRLIYFLRKEAIVNIIVIEVNKHEY